MAREIEKLDSKTFLYNGEAHATGGKAYNEGDEVSLINHDESGYIFHHAPFTDIKVLEAGGSVIIDGSLAGSSALKVVQAINNIVNFSSGSGVGALLIAKKADGKDAVFADLGALKTYYNTNPKPDSDSAAIVGTANPDGTVATITMPYVWNTNTQDWDAAATNFKGDKGDKGDTGDPTALIDDTQELADKTYSSNKIGAELEALIKEYGSNGRIRFNDTNKHFYFEVLDAGQWVQKAEIGASIIVDALRLVKGEKPTNIAADELALYNREITLQDGSKSVRPTIVVSNGDEYGFVYLNQQTDEVQFRRNDGTLVDMPHIFVDKNDVEFNNLSRVKFTGSVSVAKDAVDDNKLIVTVTGTGSTDTADEIRDKLETLSDDDRLDASAIKNIPPSTSETGEQIRDKLTALTGDDRLDITAIKGTIQEEVLDFTGDLTITPQDYLQYRGKTLSFSETGTTLQILHLPEIKKLTLHTTFIITNGREDENAIVAVTAFAGDSIGRVNLYRLSKDETITIEKPHKGKRWIITSVTRAEINEGVINGGQA